MKLSIPERWVSLQTALIPSSTQLTMSARIDGFKLCKDFLRERPARITTQLKIFMLLLEFVSHLRFLKKITRLTPDQCRIVLLYFQNHPLPLLRKGYWGVSTLIKLSVYGVPESYQWIEYVPFQGFPRTRDQHEPN